jgi:uncharacterized protein (DUF305 family)
MRQYYYSGYDPHHSMAVFVEGNIGTINVTPEDKSFLNKVIHVIKGEIELMKARHKRDRM